MLSPPATGRRKRAHPASNAAVAAIAFPPLARPQRHDNRTPSAQGDQNDDDNEWEDQDEPMADAPAPEINNAPAADAAQQRRSAEPEYGVPGYNDIPEAQDAQPNADALPVHGPPMGPARVDSDSEGEEPAFELPDEVEFADRHNNATMAYEQTLTESREAMRIALDDPQADMMYIANLAEERRLIDAAAQWEFDNITTELNRAFEDQLNEYNEYRVRREARATRKVERREQRAAAEARRLAEEAQAAEDDAREAERQNLVRQENERAQRDLDINRPNRTLAASAAEDLAKLVVDFQNLSTKEDMSRNECHDLREHVKTSLESIMAQVRTVFPEWTPVLPWGDDEEMQWVDVDDEVLPDAPNEDPDSDGDEVPIQRQRRTKTKLGEFDISQLLPSHLQANIWKNTYAEDNRAELKIAFAKHVDFDTEVALERFLRARIFETEEAKQETISEWRDDLAVVRGDKAPTFDQAVRLAKTNLVPKIRNDGLTLPQRNRAMKCTVMMGMVYGGFIPVLPTSQDYYDFVALRNAGGFNHTKYVNPVPPFPNIILDCWAIVGELTNDQRISKKIKSRDRKKISDEFVLGLNNAGQYMGPDNDRGIPIDQDDEPAEPMDDPRTESNGWWAPEVWAAMTPKQKLRHINSPRRVGCAVQACFQNSFGAPLLGVGDMAKYFVSTNGVRWKNDMPTILARLLYETDKKHHEILVTYNKRLLVRMCQIHDYAAYLKSIRRKMPYCRERTRSPRITPEAMHFKQPNYQSNVVINMVVAFIQMLDEQHRANLFSRNRAEESRGVSKQTPADQARTSAAYRM